MRCGVISLLFVAVSLAPAVIIDRNIRVTCFLNNVPLNLDNAGRKSAANRLIDQIFIRREIQLGDYPVATPQETNSQLDRLKEQRYRSKLAFEQALHRYGLTELELRTEFQWQLTVLSFIEIRFKPAVLITDDHQSRETQILAALDHFGDPLDGDNLIFQIICADLHRPAHRQRFAKNLFGHN